MAIFNKTTSLAFHDYGDVYTEQTVKSEKNENRLYLNLKNKEINTLFLADGTNYFRVLKGVVMLVVTRDLTAKPMDFVIHRICCLHAGCYYNFIPLSEEATIELSDFDYDKEVVALEKPYRLKQMTNQIDVKGIYGAYYSVRAPKYDFPGETHVLWELTYVDNGELYIELDGEEYIVREHNLLLFAPNQFHKMRTIQSCSYLTIVFDMDIVDKYVEALKNKVFVIGQTTKEILEDFEKNSAIDNEFTMGIIITDLQRCIWRLLEKSKNSDDISINTNMQKKYQNELLNEIRLYINENIYNPITVDELCQRFSLSRSSIQALFTNNLNTTPKKFISDLKFKKSKQMIRESKYTISEIACICGFSSIHYFSRKFKEYYGYTPTAYAKSIE